MMDLWLRRGGGNVTFEDKVNFERAKRVPRNPGPHGGSSDIFLVGVALILGLMFLGMIKLGSGGTPVW
jgi:hypothetical protein